MKFSSVLRFSGCCSFLVIFLVLGAPLPAQDDPEAYFAKGDTHLKEGNYIEAIGEFTHALSLDPNMSQAYFKRAVAKKGLAEQYGFNDTELCHDLVAAIHMGVLEAREVTEEKCMSSCYTLKTAFLIPENVFCADFSSSVLYELPENLDTLVNLVKLNMFNNKLEELHEDVAKLKYLVEFDLSSNKLTGIHPALTQLRVLHHLNLNKNALTTLPVEFSNLQNLTELYLRNNFLKELPASVTRLKNLERLDLSLNELTDLPVEVANLQNLKELNLVGNEISESNQAKIKSLLPNCTIYFDNKHN